MESGFREISGTLSGQLGEISGTLSGQLREISGTLSKQLGEIGWTLSGQLGEISGALSGKLRVRPNMQPSQLGGNLECACSHGHSKPSPRRTTDTGLCVPSTFPINALLLISLLPVPRWVWEWASTRHLLDWNHQIQASVAWALF